MDNLIHSAEWIAYQTASGALDVAYHATQALDVAKKALETAKQVADGAIKIAETTIEAALGALDIYKVELAATLDMFLGGNANGNHDGAHFQVEITGQVSGTPFILELQLNMSNTVQLINDLFHK